jgi:hypothetical protein
MAAVRALLLRRARATAQRSMQWRQVSASGRTARQDVRSREGTGATNVS